VAKKMEIKTRAFVHVGDQLVDVDTLSPEMRRELATQLSLAWFNTLYAGRAVFRPVEEGEIEHGNPKDV
jgi:hypothetical protein